MEVITQRRLSISTMFVLFFVGILFSLVNSSLVTDGQVLVVESGSSGVVYSNANLNTTTINGGTSLFSLMFSNFPLNELSVQKLYQLDSQAIQNLGAAWSAEYVGIRPYYFLILANNQVGGQSLVYRWNTPLKQFQLFQALPDSGSSLSFRAFQSGGNQYLIQARNDTNPANLYVWNSLSESFVIFTNISNQRSQDWEYFVYGSNEEYLLVGNLLSGPSLYSWPSLLPYSSPPSFNGVVRWLPFKIGETLYLAGCNSSTVNIYNFLGQGVTSLLQSIPAPNGPRGLSVFTRSSDSYLLIVEQNGGQSRMFKWGGSLWSFTSNFATNGAFDVEVATVFGESFPVVAANSGTSTIFRFKKSSLNGISQISTVEATDALSFSIEEEPFLFVTSGRTSGTATTGLKSLLYRL